MAIIGQIRTPNRKFISPRRYVARARGKDHVCEHGHFGCAAWEHGPCKDEILFALESEQNFLCVEHD